MYSECNVILLVYNSICILSTYTPYISIIIVIIIILLLISDVGVF